MWMSWAAAPFQDIVNPYQKAFSEVQNTAVCWKNEATLVLYLEAVLNDTFSLKLSENLS